MEYKMMGTIGSLGFHTLMYKVPQMTQDEAFTLFMGGMEPKIREQIGFHVEGHMGRAMAMAEKADMWCAKGSRHEKVQKLQEVGGYGTIKTGTKYKRKEKPGWGRKVLGLQSKDKRLHILKVHLVLNLLLWLPWGQHPRASKYSKSAEKETWVKSILSCMWSKASLQGLSIVEMGPNHA